MATSARGCLAEVLRPGCNMLSAGLSAQILATRAVKLGSALLLPFIVEVRLAQGLVSPYFASNGAAGIPCRLGAYQQLRVLFSWSVAI